MSYGHAEKLRRATEQMEAIDVITHCWLKAKRVTHDLDPETNERIVRLFLPKAPPELEATISECLHNARSALDNLVFALSSKFSKQAFTPERQEKSEFPIFCDRAPTSAELKRKIGCVDPDAQRIIKSLQPHRSPHNEWLFLLHQLNRVDKHRYGFKAALTNTGIGVGAMAFADRFQIDTMTLGGLRTGIPNSYTELGRYRGWHEIAGQRYMRVPMSVDVEAVFLDREVRGRPIAGTIRQIVENIESEIFKLLRPFL